MVDVTEAGVEQRELERHQGYGSTQGHERREQNTEMLKNSGKVKNPKTGFLRLKLGELTNTAHGSSKVGYNWEHTLLAPSHRTARHSKHKSSNYWKRIVDRIPAALKTCPISPDEAVNTRKATLRRSPCDRQFLNIQ